MPLQAPAPEAVVFEPETPPPAGPSAETPSAAPVSPASPRDYDFGFDFADTEPAPRPAEASGSGGRPSASVPPEPAAEAEEDLWSEVSLRDRGADALEKPSAAAVSPWPGPAQAFEEAVDLSAEEEVLEEVAPGRAEPPAGVQALERPPEIRPAAAPGPPPAAPAPAAAAVAAASVDPAEIERIVAERLEDALRRVLSPLVGELARKTLEEVAWEVIPDLAEAMIRAEIERVRQAASTG